MRIAITDNMGAEHKLRLYQDWIHRTNPLVELVTISYTRENISELETCSGVLLTGGGDVDPILYGGKPHPKIYGIDRKRDDFERRVIDAAMANDLPLLGVCRGLQIGNVYFGGTMLADIADAGYRSHETKMEPETRHAVALTQGTLLDGIENSASGDINSYHHQAAAGIGKDLRVSARSDDGIVEAIEFADISRHPFFLLIQWHPERMKDTDNRLSGGVLDAFLTCCKRFHNETLVANR